MAKGRKRAVSRTLTVKSIGAFTWSVQPQGRKLGPASYAKVFFLRYEEFQAWEEDRPGYLPIPAGFWQAQKNGSIEITAPAIGYGAPLRIPPGRYFIIVGLERGAWIASRNTIEIPPIDDTPPHTSDLGGWAELGPDIETKHQGKKFYIRYRNKEGTGITKWEEIPVTPRRPPRRPGKRSRGRDKIDPFADLTAAMPVLVSDIRRARRNIWIAWWALEDNFPSRFNAAGAPTRFLRNEIKAALTANKQLHVYMIIWSLTGLPKNNLTPAKVCTPATKNRLHIVWQSNGVKASHHQKFLLADLDVGGDGTQDEGAVLWCRGWDGLITYWDIHSHGDPDPYLDVVGTAHQPWHDTAARVVSEKAIRAFEEEFRRRWDDPAPLPPRPAFVPKPVGQTITVPAIHVEYTGNGPEEQSYYLASIPTLSEGLYLENQYFDDMSQFPFW